MDIHRSIFLYIHINTTVYSYVTFVMLYYTQWYYYSFLCVAVVAMYLNIAATRSNNDIDWPVHSLIWDLHGIHLIVLPSLLH